MSEKPKAPARRRAPRIHVPGDPDSPPASPDVIQDAIVEAADVTELDGDAGARWRSGAVGEDADGTVVVKRKTRRGSRGGRNRRKKPAAVEGAETERRHRRRGVATVVVDGSAEDGPAEDLPSPRARRRRAGCRARAGRRRAAAEAPVPDEAAADEPDVPGYVPMSEWLDDFDRR